MTATSPALLPEKRTLQPWEFPVSAPLQQDPFAAGRLYAAGMAATLSTHDLRPIGARTVARYGTVEHAPQSPKNPAAARKRKLQRQARRIEHRNRKR